MEFYEVVNQRRTIRDFTDKEIPEETIKKIIGAAIKAPTNNHLREVEFVVIRSKDAIEEVIKKIPHITNMQMQSAQESKKWDTTCQRKMYLDAVPKQRTMLLESGCLILPFYKQKGDLLQPKSLSSLNGFASIWCSIENILLAATAEGLACAFRIPVGDEIKYVSEYIHAPKDYVMPCYISIGYAAEDAVIIEQEEVSVENKVHYNFW